MKNEDTEVLLNRGIQAGREAVEKSLSEGLPWYYGLFPFIRNLKAVHEHRHELTSSDAVYVELIWKRIMNYLENWPAVAREFIEWNKKQQ